MPFAYYSLKDTEPTIHIESEFMGIKCSLSLLEPKWVNSIEGEIPYNDIDVLIDFLSEKDSEFPELTHYELARRIWNINQTNKELKVPKMNMPNYYLLKQN